MQEKISSRSLAVALVGKLASDRFEDMRSEFERDPQSECARLAEQGWTKLRSAMQYLQAHA